MSQIKAKISEDLKEAMKNADTFRRDTLRLLNSAFKQVEVDKRIELSDEDVIGILKSAYKQREDALQSYIAGNREDLAQKEKAEMEIILQYLPKQLNDEELEEEMKKIIQEAQASTMADLGKVMNLARRLSSVADGKRMSAIAKKLLNS